MATYTFKHAHNNNKTFTVEASTAQEAIKASRLVDGADVWVDCANEEAYASLGINWEPLEGDELDAAYAACDAWLIENYGSLEEAYLSKSGDWSLVYPAA